jgi:hypothetical protein
MSVLLLLLGYFLQDPQKSPPAVALDGGAAVAAAWQEIADSVVTAKMECRHLFVNCNNVDLSKCPTREDMSRIVQEQLVPALGTPSEADAILRLTEGLSAESGFVGGWHDLTEVSDSGRLRNDQRYKTGDVRTRVREAGKEIYYSSDITQAGASPQQSQIKMWDLKDVWFVPGKELLERGDYRIDSLTASSSRLTRGGLQIDFDPISRFVTRVSSANPGGHSVYERFQVLPQSVDGYEVPYVSASFHFKHHAGKDRVWLVDLFVVESVIFNAELSDDEFRVAAPPGTVVSNELLTEGVPAVVKLQSSAADISTVAAPVPVVPPLANQANDGASRHLILFNIALVVLLCVVLLLRRLRMKRNV